MPSHDKAGNRRRSARYRMRHRARVRNSSRISQAKYHAKHKNEINERRRSRADRNRARELALGYAEVDTASTVVSALQLRRPDLYYLDEDGRLHREDTRSAEELIRDFQRKEKRRGKKATAEEAQKTTSSPPQATSPAKATSH